MTIQTIQFESLSLRQIGSGTITAEIYSGSTSAATLSSITEDATRDGRYTGTVEDEAAGTYDLQVQFDGVTVSEPDEQVTLLLAVGTYVSKRLAELDSASRLAIWNTLTTETFTADSFGELLIISDGTNGREVKVTASGHMAADIHDVQPDGLSGSTEIINIENASGYLLAVLAGACADPQTASETYAITVFGSTFTVDMAGQTSTGTRTAPTLTKT